MNECSLLKWLYADIDEIIDFDGYNKIQEESNEREQSVKNCHDNAGPVCNDIR